ncbi:gas vesicle protein K [Prosthecochloris sp. SCSIO W1101]|uniref:gas vesicle protein K n=1 Tax=Prosthecochloris sp. SCSIO W1101 TaxID=2992242 RepID=UPI00223E1892|nr:gas vesicle protein K [Prosthecochloris sp. SCSIO W1101]UZJ41172.1 gas vesicle protein K [Prosthecochloris sp. SCSIO W1101]
MEEKNNKVLVGSDDVETFAEELANTTQVLPRHIDVNPENVEHGLAKLVLTLVELIRKLMEKQAMRRMDGGSLSEEEIERLGESMLLLENKMDELKNYFGLKNEDLNLDLGPLGKLM